MPNSTAPITNLQIVIDNTGPNNEDSNEVMVEEMLEIEEDSNSNLEAETKLKVDDEETEFHVNLNKVPPSLQNTILSDKIYLNESNEPANLAKLDFISPDDQKGLYESLGLKEENFMSEEEAYASSQVKYYNKDEDLSLVSSLASFRKDSLHLFGVDELSTSEVCDYFKDTKPFAVEWINDSTCNVVWRNPVHASNALLQMSVEYNESDSESYFKNTPDLEENSEQIEDGQLDESEPNFKNRLPPQGCRWRKGVKSIKNHQIWLRYVRKSDKKIKGAEARSKFYVKFGNPNYGNMKGLLSSSMRLKLKAKQMKDATSGLTDEVEEIELDNDNTRRRPVAYDFDSYKTNYESDNEIEEFGTSEIMVKKEPIKLISQSRSNFDRRKKMGLYADELNSGEESLKRLYADDSEQAEKRFNGKYIHKKSRYEPYNPSASKRSSLSSEISIKSRLSGLRPDDRMDSRLNSRHEKNRMRSDRRSYPSSRVSHRPSNNFSREKDIDDEKDGSESPEYGIKSKISSVVHVTSDLRNRLNRYK